MAGTALVETDIDSLRELKATAFENGWREIVIDAGDAIREIELKCPECGDCIAGGIYDDPEAKYCITCCARIDHQLGSEQ